MLMHIKAELPSTMHLPVSTDNTLHFYRYLCTHILVEEEQFLLLIDVPIQDHAHSCWRSTKSSTYSYYEETCQHDMTIDTKYLGISHDKTKAIEILEHQFTTCQWANGQFCKIEAPLQPLANPTWCVTAIYAKNKVGIECQCSLQIRNTCSTTIPTLNSLKSVDINLSNWVGLLQELPWICPDQGPKSFRIQQPLHVLCLALACSATSQHLNISIYHLTMRIIRWQSTYLLNTAYLNAVNISSPEFWVWQHLEDHWNKTPAA